VLAAMGLGVLGTIVLIILVVAIIVWLVRRA
jgi:cbb3-type cytochrome oxidase subunit 3